MAKPKVGLALGAGGARGLAHLGVLEVFERENLPVDMICGSSMGAVVGGIYAVGTDVSMLIKILPTLDAMEYFDVVNPKHGGLLRGERFHDLIRMFSKNATFSQTRTPFSCVAVDVARGELVVLDRPDMRVDEAIRASMSIPGVFLPHVLDGRVLVDGGVLSRLPAATVRGMGADIVIGVDVGYRHGDVCDLENHGTIVDYLMAATDIMAWEITKMHEKEADLVLLPNVHCCDPNSFADAPKAVQAGREAAEQALPQIRSLLAAFA